jgi:predicted ATPase/DNA-binding CsgD family transcriptional regulator
LEGLRSGDSALVTFSNLPAALTSLVGRAEELRAVESLLSRTRLVTLTGTGGSGKTRLALAAAQAAGQQFPGGRWWVELASVLEPDQVPAAVAAALGVSQSPGEQAAVTLCRQLRERQALLVLDNCEQVVEGCAALADVLLRSCPRLQVLATSREVIGLAGETVFGVHGLPLPAGTADAPGNDAVSLFTQRARAALPGFWAGPSDVAAIAGLCRQLDGLPLAIELAAARVSILSVTQIAERLAPAAGRIDRSAPLLRHPSRTAPVRHRTLQATLDWSHRLLTADEQILFRRLAVFRGSFNLPAAEAVAVAGTIGASDLVDLMAGLVSKSLLLVSERGAGYRYQMLETIRQYGVARLAASDEQDQVEDAHASFFLRLAADARAGLDGADQAQWLDRLEAEHDNLIAVLARAVGRRPGDAAKLAGLLWPFWYRRGHYQEARSWLEQVVCAASAQPMAGDTLAEALAGAGALAFLQCDYPAATERLSKARSIYEEIGDQAGLAATVTRLGSVAREQGRYADARRLHEESRALYAHLGDAAGVASSQLYLGFAAWLSGDAVRAAALCRQALAAFEAAGRRHETASARMNLGVALRMTGALAESGRQLQASLDISRELGYQEMIAWALHELAVSNASDDLPGAALMLAESLDIHLRLGDRWRLASVVESIAELLPVPDDAATAAALLGSGHALRRSMGAPVPPAERPELEACRRRLRDSLGPPAFTQAWVEGEAAPLADLAERAAAAAQSLAARQQGPAARELDQLGLTAREVAVLRLVAQGLTNRQIGHELAISAGTAGVHVSNLLRKLGVTSRVQAATAAHRLGI